MKDNFGIARQLKNKRKKRRRIRLFFYFFSAVLCAAAIFYFVFFSGYFDTHKVSFSGMDAIAADEARKAMDAILDESVFFASSRRNIFLFSTASAERALEDYFPRIETVHVSKKFFAKEIRVVIAERQPAGIACGKEENVSCFYFDNNGVLFANAPVITGATVLMVKDGNLPSPQALPFTQYARETIAFMRGAKQAAYDIAGATIISFSLVNEYGDMEAVTLEGYAILFTTERDFLSQARIVKNLLALEIKEQVSQLDYIDLRVENRAYYKLREPENMNHDS